MPKITTFLTYDDRAEDAVKLYTSVFPNSRILDESRYPEGGPGPAGGLMTATFELDGQEYTALNGGPSFSFAQGISLLVNCETQEEVDHYWSALTANGGSEGPCGWLTDPFGVSWQIIPRVLGELLSDPDPARAQRAVTAMLQMQKLDIAELQRAADG